MTQCKQERQGHCIFMLAVYITTQWLLFLFQVNFLWTCCPWSNGLRPKSFKLLWWCKQLMSKFLAKCYLPRVSLQSRLLANDKEIMKWYQGLCTDLLGFTLQMRKTPENHRRRRLCYSVYHRLKCGSLPPNTGKISQHVRKGEGRNDVIFLYFFYKSSNTREPDFFLREEKL